MDKKQFDELADRAEELAKDYHKKYGGCSQSTLAALKDTLANDMISADAILAATGFAGGVGRCGFACGAMSGGIMAISMHWGRPYSDLADPQKRRARTLSMCKKLVDKFIEKYGSPNCAEIVEKNCGRKFDFWVQEEHEAFMANGHEKCYQVSGDGARWTLEILYEEGLI